MLPFWEFLFGWGGAIVTTSSELAYADVVFNDEDQQIRNRVTATRRGGTLQVAEDTTSRTSYLLHGHDLGTVECQNDNETLNACQWVLAHYKDPNPRIDELAIRPQRDPSRLFTQVLAREMGDRVTVRRRPQGLGLISQDVFIEGMSFDVAPHLWTVSWALSPVDTQTYWTLDASALDSTTRLAY